MNEIRPSIGRDAWAAWSRFWFAAADSRPLAAIRIGTCGVLLHSYLTTLPEWSAHYGPQGWIDQAAMRSLRDIGGTTLAGSWSIWMATGSEGLLRIGFAVFLLSLCLGLLGCGTRWAIPIAWVGHIGCAHRGLIYLYGADSLGAVLLLYLAIAPAGARWSFDAWYRRRRGRDTEPPSVAANVALRCVQLHMCVVYGAAGLAKLAGPMWWSGTAVWYAAMTPELWPWGLSPTWLLGPGLVGEMIVNVATLGSVALEIALPFLVWRRRLRGPLLIGLFAMHLGTGVLMGLGSFGAIMSTGLLAFVPPTLLERVESCVARRRRSVTPVDSSECTSSAVGARRAA